MSLREHYRLIIIVLVAVTLMLAVQLLKPRAPKPAPLTYCKDEPAEGIPRCPPEPGARVLGEWENGSVATVTWTGSQWHLSVPGARKVTASPPVTWSDQ